MANMNEIFNLNNKQVIQGVIRELQNVFPDRPPKATQTMAEVMEVAGQQQVIQYLQRTFGG